MMLYRQIMIVVAVAIAGAAHAAEPSVAPFPPVGDYQVLRCDFHVHTPHSDGKLTPVERVEEAVKFGYDAIAITDHGNFKSYEEALPRATELNLVLIRGMETGLDDREHLVAVNLDPSYTPKNPHSWALEPGQKNVYYQEQLPKLAKDAGAFMVYAHPHVGLEEPVLWGIKQGFIKGIEVKNGVVGKGWNTINSHGTWFYPQALDWAIDHNLALFANSDAHEARNSENSPTTLVLAEKRSPEGVMAALLAGRTIAWFDGMLWGKQGLLEKAMQNFASVSVENGKVKIVNHTPATLKAVVDGTEIEIKPNAEASADVMQSQNPLAIRWTNVWVSSTKTLETSHTML